MKKLFPFLCSLALLLAVPPRQAQSAMRIMLFNSGAAVNEQRTITAENGTLRFPLPLAANVDTLNITVKGIPVAGLSSRIVSAPAAWSTTPLHIDIERVRKEIHTMESRLQVIEAGIAFWLEPRPQINNLQSLTQIETQREKKLSALYAEKAALSAPLQQKQAELKRFEEQLGNKDAAQTVREIIASVPEGTALSGPCPVTLTYHLDHCGWHPMMRLDALTKTNEVEISRLAVIKQTTGLNWNEADITLSTLSPSSSLQPPALRDWRIRPQPQLRMIAKTRSAEDAAAPLAVHQQADAVPLSRPAHTEQASSGLWSLGGRTIPTGETVIIALDTQRWKADFFRLARPSRTETAYLMASVKLENPITIPRGPAMFQIDGAAAGSRDFSFAGAKGEIAFGADPSLLVKMQSKSAQSGEKGLIDKRSTYEWNWTITVLNAHNFPVRVRIEDPEPQPGNKDISVSVTSNPPAEIKNHHTLAWEMDVPEGGQREIEHKVRFSAPKELHVMPGR